MPINGDSKNGNTHDYQDLQFGFFKLLKLKIHI